MGVKTPFTVVQYVSKRSNSQFMMIECLLKLRVSIYGVILDEKVTKASDRANLALPEVTWKVMEDIVPILAHLAEATQIVASENLPTNRQVYVLLHHLMAQLKPSDDDSKLLPKI